MTDLGFERRIERVLNEYADDAVVPIDPFALAIAARADEAGVVSRVARSVRVGRPSAEVRLLAIAAALLAALVIGTWLIGGSQRQQPSLVQVAPAPDATSPTATVSPAALAEALVGTWLADIPRGFSLGEDAGRMSLVIDTDGAQAIITTSDGRAEHFRSMLESPGGERLVVTQRAAGGPMTVAGVEQRGCAANEAGTWQVSRSADGLLLTLAPVDDPCPSRVATFARTWVRSHGEISTGGVGVVDAFDPMFSVDLPAGSYFTERGVTDAITIAQAVPEYAFLAFKDPQGFVDPCDPGAGRYPIEAGADAFVAYFRQLEGFTVDSVTDREVDGNRAVRLVVHANVDASCPGTGLAEWQPKAVTNDAHWFLRPGDTDTLVVVELADATVMFQLLPGVDPGRETVIDTIRFLDGLPTNP